MPKTLPVLTIPDERLRKPAKPVSLETIERLRAEGFFDALIATMRKEDGVGIAATQVGSAHRIFVALESRTPQVYINPEIFGRSIRTAVDTEGCLSVPGVIGAVRRAKSVTLRALTMEGKSVERRAKDLIARIYQHELDHLDGVLFIDRAVQLWETKKDAPTPRV